MFFDIGLILIITTLYITMLWISIKRIRRMSSLSREQKRLNILMVIIIPVIWIPLIFALSKPEPTIFDLKEMRDFDKRDLHWKDPPEEG